MLLFFGLTFYFLFVPVAGNFMSNSSNFRKLEEDNWAQVGAILTGDSIGDHFGISNDLSGDGKRLAVLRPGSTNGAPYSHDGKVEIFDYEGGNWNLVHTITTDANDQFRYGFASSEVRLSLDGNVLAVGSAHYGGNSHLNGGVRVYAYDGSSWSLKGDYIDGGGWLFNEGFDRGYFYAGMGVALSEDGNILAVGAPDRAGYARPGMMRVYTFSDGSWAQLGQDLFSQVQEGDHLGMNVDLSADGLTAVAGAPNSAQNRGRMYVFKYNSETGNWSSPRYIEGRSTGEYFGYNVAISRNGDIISGASGRDQFANGCATDYTQVYKYNANQDEWEQLGDDIVGYNNGMAISGDGKTLAAANRYASDTNTGVGETKILKYVDTEWIDVGETIVGIGESEYDGNYVSLSESGKTIAVCAHHADDNTGRVRVFQFGAGEEDSSPATPTSELGRFELSHREGIGTIDQVEPVLKASVLFQAGPKVTKEKLTVELYGMTEKDDDATHKCSDGVPITDTNILTINDISFTTGIASFDLNLKRTTDAQKVTDGAKVDVCARIVFEDSDLDVLTNLDTRFQIVRTYETEVGGISFDFNIGDPSTSSIGKDEVTNVLVSAFFCYESKDPVETDDKEFTPGQDVRVCLQPTQDNDSNFEYAITTIKDVKCSVSEDSSFDIEFGGRNEIDSEPNDEGILSFVFVLMDSLLVNLDESRELDCKGTAVLSSTRIGGRKLDGGEGVLEVSFHKTPNRSLQTTSSEDVDFGITLTIAEDGSGGATISTTFVSIAMALLGAFYMAHF